MRVLTDSFSARTYFEGAPQGAFFIGFTRENALQAVSPDPPHSQNLEGVGKG